MASGCEVAAIACGAYNVERVANGARECVGASAMLVPRQVQCSHTPQQQTEIASPARWSPSYRGAAGGGGVPWGSGVVAGVCLRQCQVTQQSTFTHDPPFRSESCEVQILLPLLFASAGALALSTDSEDAGTEFGDAARVSADFDNGLYSSDSGTVVMPDGNGGYWIAGWGENDNSTTFNPAWSVGLVHVTDGGELDTGFGTNGRLDTGIAGTVFDGFLDSQGRIVLAVRTGAGSIDRVIRLTDSGALDTTFAGDGGWEGGAALEAIWAIEPAANDGVWVSRRETGAALEVQLTRLDAQGVPTTILSSSQIAGQPFSGVARCGRRQRARVVGTTHGSERRVAPGDRARHRRRCAGYHLLGRRRRDLR